MKKTTVKTIEAGSKPKKGSLKEMYPTKSDALLRGLELMTEYYSLGLNETPLCNEMKDLEKEAIDYMTILNQVKKKNEAIGQIVQELNQVDNILEKYQNDKEALIQILLDIQEQSHWLPKPALIWVSEKLGVPLTQIYHIGTFYKAFSLVPRGRHLIQVCLGTACQVRGGPRILDKVREVVHINPGETDSEQKFSLMTVNCLGCCALGPVVSVDKDYYSNPSVQKLKQIFASYD
jgi:NADH-quinone oxidoreductase subunit E